MKTITGSPIAGAIITFTTSEGRPPTVVFVGTMPPTVLTGNDGSFSAHARGTAISMKGTTITAHYAGAPPPNALAASSVSAQVP